VDQSQAESISGKLRNQIEQCQAKVISQGVLLIRTLTNAAFFALDEKTF